MLRDVLLGITETVVNRFSYLTIQIQWKDAANEYKSMSRFFNISVLILDQSPIEISLLV